MKTAFFFAAAAVAATLISQQVPPERVGEMPDGGFRLVSGWVIRPAGRQVALDTFPMSTAISADGKHLLVLNGGYKPPSISVLETAGMTEVSRVPVPDGWLGLTFAPGGKLVYVGGGSRASVYEFAFADGKLTPARTFTVVPEGKRTHEDFVGDVALSPDGRLIYAAGLYRNVIHVINPQSGMVIEQFPTGRRPYRILFHPDGKSYLVSSWADGSIYHHQASDGQQLQVLRLGQHPTDMLIKEGVPQAGEEEEGEKRATPTYKARLFVAAANTNNVYVAAISESKQLRAIETINVAMTPRQPAGMTPSALGFSIDGKRLFTVCSDANAVAVTDISEPRSRVLGFIPTAWYPTAVRQVAGGRLVILNGRGLRSFANPKGPNPSVRVERTHTGTPVVQYVGRLQTGSASVIEPFDDEQLAAWTRIVVNNSPYRDALLDRVETGPGNPVPSRPGDPTPIEHVIYIVKENRTYDQVLGDLGKGNGDPSLTLFGEEVTPNHHKLAREFVLFDNFYVNADVSADGHNWSTSAIAPDYVQKMWPNSYGGRRRHYDYEGGEPAAYPPAGYLWTNAASAGITMRNYGWWSSNKAKATEDGIQIERVRDPILQPVTSMQYRAYDLDYPDVERAKVFLGELAEFEQKGAMPRLIFIRIGNDHTSGTAAGKIAPKSAVADNDYALGMIVEGLSKSRFWPRTAVFVLEDDAQNGPDHVDSHRSPAFVLSPYTRRGIIDSTMYNTTSMLRTMELILGMRPMTSFDAGARPMSAAFATKPDPRPYEAEKPRISLETRNPAVSPTAARSARLDLSEADLIDDAEMNDILWRALRNTEMPPPQRSLFSR